MKVLAQLVTIFLIVDLVLLSLQAEPFTAFVGFGYAFLFTLSLIVFWVRGSK